jgi:putative ABC transport system ATP-binding protein
VIAATHDLKMLKASDRIVWIDDGLITRLTTPEEMKIEVEEVH